MKSTKILLRIAADLQREIIRTNLNKSVQKDLNYQIEALMEFKKEIDDFRAIKKILNNQSK